MAASERVASPRELNKHSRTPIARAIGSNLDRSVSPPGQTFETSICFDLTDSIIQRDERVDGC
jgi:hypothetical protein